MSSISPDIYVHTDLWTYILHREKLVKYLKIDPISDLLEIKGYVVHLDYLVLVYTDTNSSLKLKIFKNVNGSLNFIKSIPSTLFANDNFGGISIHVDQTTSSTYFHLYMVGSTTTYIVKLLQSNVFDASELISSSIMPGTFNPTQSDNGDKYIILNGKLYLTVYDLGANGVVLNSYPYNYQTRSWEFPSVVLISDNIEKYYSFRDDVTLIDYLVLIIVGFNVPLTLTVIDTSTHSIVSSISTPKKLSSYGSPDLQISHHSENIGIATFKYVYSVVGGLRKTVSCYLFDLTQATSELTSSNAVNLNTIEIINVKSNQGINVLNFDMVSVSEKNNIKKFMGISEYLNTTLGNNIEYYSDFLYTSKKLTPVKTEFGNTNRVFLSGGAVVSGN